MDAADVVSKLHGLDPQFRDICEALYPGLEPAQIAEVVYKSEPSSADVHVPSTQWRNGRGHTRGRGRRKIDNAVTSTRFVKAMDPERKRKLMSGAGLATTGVGTGISAVSLPKHLKKLPTAMRAAKTSDQPMSAGIKNAVGAVRNFSKPSAGAAGAAEAGAETTPKGFRTGMQALGAGARVARENPRISAGLLLGATALHTANLGGEAIATHELAAAAPGKNKHSPALAKAWTQAQAEITTAYRQGRISKADALALGRQVYVELASSQVRKAGFGGPGALTSGSIKLTALKAPTPVMADGPHTSPSSVNAPTPAKSKKGKTGTPSKTGVKKDEDVVSFDAEVEFSKLDEDKQQCFGWCSVVKVDGKDVVDKQDDLIGIEDIEKAAYDYVLSSRAGGTMHQRGSDGGVHKVADMIESFVLTPEKIEKMGLPDTVPQGWWIGMQVHDPEAWVDVKSGKLRGFSIHGVGKRVPVLVDS